VEWIEASHAAADRDRRTSKSRADRKAFAVKAPRQPGAVIHVEITHHGLLSTPDSGTRQAARGSLCAQQLLQLCRGAVILTGGEGMESELQNLAAAVLNLWQDFVRAFHNLFLPSRINQMAILVACAAVAYLLKRVTGPKMNDWLRAREGWPKWRLKAGLTLQKRLWLIFFILLTWSAALALSQIVVFPSGRYLVTLFATIATAWLLVGLAGRLIANRLLRRIVTWGLWIYVTLHYVGLTGKVGGFLDGISITLGDFRLSALSVMKALVVTTILVTLARFVAQSSTRRLRGNQDMSPAVQELAVKTLQVLLYGSAFFMGLKAIGFDLTGLAVLSGAIGVGLGFGLQKVVSNLVSGIIILLDKSVKPGDVISLGDTFGWIASLGARYVSVVTRDGKEYLIPNEDLITGQVVNWSHSNEFVRIDLFFGTSYNDDPHLVRKIAVEAAVSVPRVLKNRPAVCHITGFGDSSVDYILRFWITDPVEGLTNVRGSVYLALWDTFKEHGITIPFPQREVKVLPGSVLRAASAAATADQDPVGTASSRSPG
jgi:small-conductance mechanosensitive channel